MFGLGKKDAQTPAQPEPETQTPSVGKGRPTPTRKEAEEARKRALKGPTDPKARRRLEKDQARAERNAAREALMSGDESALPARDAGPARKYVRDFVDSRWTLGEFFIPIAIVVLIAGLMRNPQLQMIISYVWFIMLLLLVADMTILLLRLRKQLKAQFPDPADRKGTMFYAGMRALQIRRLRLPPPKVKAGGKPVEPKKKKQKA